MAWFLALIKIGANVPLGAFFVYGVTVTKCEKCDIEQIRGKTDYDFAPAHIAKQFIRDDEKVLAGKMVTERL